MKISYAITVCNELEEVKRLIDFLHQYIRPEDEICVLLDKPKASQHLIDQLYRYSSSNWINLKESTFQGHFADWKNELNRICSGDYIFQIDADEIPEEFLIQNLKQVIESNPVDCFIGPRKNLVEGLTQEHIQQWGWVVNENGWVNWPDIQKRIYKNNPDIKWDGHQVHGMVTGYKTFVNLPLGEEWSIIHNKTITRQEQQNERYTKIELKQI